MKAVTIIHAMTAFIRKVSNPLQLSKLNVFENRIAQNQTIIVPNKIPVAIPQIQGDKARYVSGLEKAKAVIAQMAATAKDQSADVMLQIYSFALGFCNLFSQQPEAKAA